MEETQLIPHLFRTEYRKITSVLCKRLGIDHIETAEDIASDTFMAAVESWSFNGLPANPVAWLYAVARNKAKNRLIHQKIFTDKVAPKMRSETAFANEFDLDLSESNITDSQLQMLFALCHPSISKEAQIGLSLRILCGFGIEEIADAFLTSKDTINKRLTRARQKLREENIPIRFPEPGAVDARLEVVLTTLYLLFSEGYYSGSHEATIRKDLCLEAMRLTYLLLENEHTNKPSVNALLSLMCFQSSRLAARTDQAGHLILYENQDVSLWNQELIAKGAYFFHQASKGSTLSRYHLEAGIAYWHTQKADTPEKWGNILTLYNHLLRRAYSSVTALNRTYALSKVYGKKRAIEEALKLNLADSHFYFLLLGDLYKDQDPVKSRMYLNTALSMAKTSAERTSIQSHIDRMNIHEPHL